MELKKAGLPVAQQHPVDVLCEGEVVGRYLADLLVENEIVAGIKAAKMTDDAHFLQCLNYLKATGLKVGLVLNFGNSRIEVKRIVNSL